MSELNTMMFIVGRVAAILLGLTVIVCSVRVLFDQAPRARSAASTPTPSAAAARAASRPMPCGVINTGTARPCVLEDGHRDHEHASCWGPDPENSRRQMRHRWDSNDVIGREESRWLPGFLPRYTAEGDDL